MYRVQQKPVTLFADRPRIRLGVRPFGWTDEPQSLGWDIFRALKSICRRFFHRHDQMHNDICMRKPSATRLLIEAEDSLNADVTNRAGGIHDDIFDDVKEEKEEEVESDPGVEK
jgi:hypothetical protein